MRKSKSRLLSSVCSMIIASCLFFSTIPVQAVESTNKENQLSDVGAGRKVVVIDPGHDSRHTGATREGVHEEKLTLKIAQATYDELKTYQGVDVYMTRNSESCTTNSTTSVCLNSRSTFAKQKNADLFVSIHINSTGADSQTSISGALVYISNYSKYTASSTRLTNNILSAINKRSGMKTHGAWTNADDGTNGTYDDGRLKDDLAVIRNCVLNNIEPVLIEHAFINNPNDRAYLSNDANLKQLGIANAEGIAQYLGLSKNGWNIDSVSTSVSGQNVTIKPSISGTSGTKKYKYVYNRYNYSTNKYDWSDWDVIKDFSSNSSYTWKAPKDGKYEIYVDVEDSNGVKKSYSKEVIVNPWTFSFTGVNAPSTLNLGKSTTISPKISGTTSGLKYKYVWSYKNWSDWDVIKDFSSDKSATFKPTKSGQYDLYVDVKTSNGSIWTYSVPITITANIGMTGVNAPSEAYIGDTINFSPIANNELPGLKFKYVWCYNDWADWDVIKDFSTAQSASYTPKKAGTYKFYVDIMASNGVKVSDFATVKVHNNTLSSVSVSSSAKTGSTVTIKPKASSTSGMQYKYVWSYNNWEEWDVIKDFSSDTSATLTVKKPGTYTFYVDARPKGASSYKSASANTAVSYSWNPNSISFSSSTATVNKPIKITGSASGASNLEYKFVYAYDGKWNDWDVIKASDASNSTNFTPTRKGTYVIYMDVYDVYGNQQTIQKSLTVK